MRCTRDGSPGEWRRPASITSTLLHEIAHLRHDNHGARFWNLYRRLLDEAATAGIYDPADEDPKERSQGDLKLAGSVAHGVAEAARQADRERARTARAAAAQWNPGDRAVIGGSSVLAGTLVEVVARRRTRVAVATADNRRYLVPGPLLEPAIDPSTVRRDDRWHGWKPGDVALVGGRNALSGTEVRVVSRLRTRLEVVLGDGRQYLVPPGLLIRPDEVPEVLPPVAPPRMAPAASLGMSPVASLEMSPVASPEMSPAAAAQLPLFPV